MADAAGVLMSVYYLRFSQRVCIGATDDLTKILATIPHDELLGLERGGEELAEQRRTEFVDARVLGMTGDWFYCAPALIAHTIALRLGMSSDVRDRLVPVESAMLYTGKSRRTLFRWVRLGYVTRYKQGAHTLFDVLELPTRSSLDGAASQMAH